MEPIEKKIKKREEKEVKEEEINPIYIKVVDFLNFLAIFAINRTKA